MTDALLEPGGVPPLPRPAQGDHTTGLALVAAILAGLRLVEQTGDGQVVDTSLLATAAWTMATDLAATLLDRRPLPKRDRHHLISPLANRFRCADDRWIILNMPEVHWWAKVLRRARTARLAQRRALQHRPRAGSTTCPC